MATREIKTTLALDGEKKFKEGLNNAARQLRVLDSEMKATTVAFSGNKDSMESLTSRGKIFEKQVAQQKEMVAALTKAVQESSEKYGDADKKTDGYRIKLNNATTSLSKMEKQLEQNNQAIHDYEKSAGDAATKTKKFKDSVEKMSQSLKVTGEKLKSIGTTMSTYVTAPLVAGFALVTEGTRELRSDLATLETNAKTAGQSMEEVNAAMTQMSAVTGETDSNVEGLSNILAAGFKGEQLTELVDQLAGASLKFKDTLKFEGIADGLQETLATGEAIGPFEELLSRSGVSIDKFNKGLQSSIKNGTQNNYILETLANEGLADVYKEYRKNNEELVKSAEATYNLKTSLAGLGKTLEPILTPIITKITELLTKFNEMSPTGQKIILTIVGIAAAIGPLLVVVSTLITAMTTIGGAFTAVSTAIAGAGGFVAVLGAIGAALTSTVALIIAAVALIAFAVYEIITNWEEIKEFFTDLFVALGKMFIAFKDTILGIVTGYIDKQIEAYTNFGETIKSIVAGIGDFFSSKWTWIKDTVLGIIKDFLEGIDKKITGIKDSVVEGLEAAIEYIKSLPEKAIEWGKDIIEGLWEGIKTAGDNLKTNFTSFFDDLISNVKDELGIHSPSKIFSDIGSNISLGLAEGIIHGGSAIEKALSSIETDMKISVSSNYNSGVKKTSTSHEVSGSGDTIILNVKMDEVDEISKLVKVVKQVKQTGRAGFVGV